MSKYIDVNKTITEIEKHLRTGDEVYPLQMREKWLNEGLITAADVVYNQPAADVAEVRHGRWVIIEDLYGEMAKCSLCGFFMGVNEPTNGLPDIKYLNYCPNCGSRMDLDEVEE